MNIETKYFDLDLGHKQIQFRKWKAKDRKKLKNSLASDKSDITSLVWDCIKEPVDLNPHELQYVFIKIREASISDSFEFSYPCDCERVNKEIIKINDILSFTWSQFAPINVGNYTIDIGPVRNQELYNKAINNPDNADSVDILDLAFHTYKINGDENFTFEGLLEFYDNLDIDILDSILENYEKQIFVLQNTKEFVCECGKKHVFEFDEIPNFFPEKWFK